MPCAIGLLTALAAVSALSSFITQGQTYAYYAEAYSERAAGWIMALGLDDAFHSPWYIALAVLLCVQLLSCNLVRFPQILRRVRGTEGADEEGSFAGHLAEKKGSVSCEGVTDAEAFLKKMQMPSPKEYRTEDGKRVLYAAKNRAGYFGAWICHFGILLLVAGFGLGQMTKEEYAVYGVPGDSRAVGDTGYICTIDSFEVIRHDDGSLDQYEAGVTVRDADTGRMESGTISVNHPATIFGLRYYQNSTGWAAKVTVQENGELLQEQVVCAGDFVRVKDKQDLVIYLNVLYPDYVYDAQTGPMTLTNELNNPAYLYSVYYKDQMLGMNALLETEEITIDDYTVTFSEPQSYTLISVKRDRFTYLALIGALVTMLGLLIALYVQPVSVWAYEEDGKWTVHGECAKGGAFFKDRFKETAEQYNGKIREA